MKQIILASKSPRREKLLNDSGLSFKIEVSHFDEESLVFLSPIDMVRKLSFEKAKLVADKFPESIIIGADTTVVFKGEIIGKPKDAEDAFRILNLLSGNTHEVITGFTVISGDKIITEHEILKVVFKKLSRIEIDEYIKSGEPFDKAGGYGIQDGAGKFVKKVIGDYENVIGLPVSSVINVLDKISK